MKNTTDGIQNTLPIRELREDEYINGADGLVYCAKCHTPRQKRFERSGKVFMPYFMCRCQGEAHRQAEKEREQRGFLEKVSRLKTSGLQDKALFDYTFANDSGVNPEMQKARSYVEHWDDMKLRSIGLLLLGGMGTGKTFCAGCIANALLEQGIPVLMTNFARILNSLIGMQSNDRNQFMNSFNRYSLLIIDDLGMERNSEFALEQVFNVVDSWYRSKKPLIVTTNLTLTELHDPPDQARSRIYGRILERCVPLKINNQNIRELNAAENIKQAKKLLG